MKFICHLSEVRRGLDAVAAAVGASPRYPILSHVLLNARAEGILELTANNLQFGIIWQGAAEIEEAGSIAVPFTRLADLLAHLPPQSVDDPPVAWHVPADAASLVVESGCSRGVIRFMRARDFPPVPVLGSAQTGVGQAIHVDGRTFAEAVDRVAFAAAQHVQLRRVLQGVLFEGQAFSLTARDTGRLATCQAPLSPGMTFEGQVVIPPAALAALARHLKTVQDRTIVQVLIAEQRSLITFLVAGLTLTSVLFGEGYPPYRYVLNRDVAVRVVVATEGLYRAIMSIAPVARGDGDLFSLQLVRGMNGAGDTLSVAAAEPGVGGQERRVDIDSLEGEADLHIQLQVQRFAEILKAAGSPHVALEQEDAGQTVLIRPLGLPPGMSATYIDGSWSHKRK